MKRKSDGHGSDSTKDKIVFKRNFEHVDGNWPSHVFLDGSYRKLRAISQACLSDAVSSSLSPPIEPIDKPHLSISRPFVLRHHHITHFIQRLGELVEHFQCLTVHVDAAYYWLRNDNGTREFIALPVKDTRGKLTSLVRLVDEVLLSFQQPKYYEDPLFHISVGSRLPSAGLTADWSSHLPTLHIVQPQKSNINTNSHGSSDTQDSSSEEEEDTPSWLRGTESCVDGEEGGVPAMESGERAIGNAGAVRMLSGVLAGYDGEDDDDSERICNNIAGDRGVSEPGTDATTIGKKPEPVATGPAASIVLTFTAVVCKIGNRTFRMDLLPLSGNQSEVSAAGRSMARRFAEVSDKS